MILLIYAFVVFLLFAATLVIHYRNTAISLYEQDGQKNRDRLREICNLARIGLWDFNFNTFKSTWSDESYAILGLRPGDTEPSLENFLNYIHPEDKERVTEITQKGYKIFVGYSFQCRVVTKQGRVKHIFAKCRYELDANGKPEMLYGIMQDISDLMIARSAANRSERKFMAVMETSADAILILDACGKINYCSPAFESFSGFNKKEIEGRSFMQLANLMKFDGLNRLVRDFKRQGNCIQNRQLAIQNKAGRTLWVECTILSMLDDNNMQVLVCNLHEITEKKNLELYREKMAADLVQRNKALEQFTYIVSHNLRAPLANIIGLSKAILQFSPDMETAEDFMEHIYSSAIKLDEVIMDLNKILQVKHSVNEYKDEVYFSEVLDEVKSLVTGISPGVSFKILSNFNEVGSIYSIKSYLQSIFYNLVSNSIKYRQKDRPETLIEVRSSLCDDKLVLQFKDNGTGIDLERNSDKVFELYKRFHYEVEGKGMGLYMVRTQVESMGGTVSVNSKVNIGTEFRIEFPYEHQMELCSN